MVSWRVGSWDIGARVVLLVLQAMKVGGLVWLQLKALVVDCHHRCCLGATYRYSDGEIEQQVVQLRNTLTQEGYKSRPLDPSSAYETHKIAEASEQKDRQLKSAFGIREDYQEGSAFDPVQRALLAAQAREEREKHQTE